MTDGGKPIREQTAAPASPFARLQPLVSGSAADVGGSMTELAQALASYGAPARIHLRLIDDSGSDDGTDHWDVEAGAKKSVARQGQPKAPDVTIVLRRSTWMQIAHGQISPFDALFAGRLRVGGDVELAKRLAEHLSDPSVPFVSPC